MTVKTWMGNAMRNYVRSANLLIGLLVLSVVGCGTSPADQPAKLTAQETAAPIDAERQASDPRPGDAPVVDSAVRQASFEESTGVPQVLLTAQHEALCRVKVGDTLPAIELPKLGGGRAKLADLYGRAATVVVFWKSDRRMTLDELADLGPDVVEPFGTQDVAVVGIAVEESAGDARAVLSKAGAKFTNLLDADGQAFAKVGSQKLPWTLVLDASGQVVWFDLEYSHATRRELEQTLQATVR
jgi:peroxiredoxin